MRNSSPRAYRQEPAAALVERQQQRQEPWPSVEHRAGFEPAATPMADAAGADQPAETEPAVVSERMISGARSLARQVKALQQRYQEEHRRLVDVLEFLTVQSRDLESELLAFGQLAETLEREAVRVPTPARPEAGAERLNGATSLFRPVESARPEAVGWGTADEPGSPGLAVRCLGGFDARYRGHPLDLGSSRNGRLIFKYLAARAPGHRASKELLAELCWPDVPIERALASLQSAVHQLKRALHRSAPELAARPTIVYADDLYALPVDLELHSDVELFRRHLKEARAQEARGQAEAAGRAFTLAHEAYGGEFLPEERYEEWVIAERTSLAADHLAVLTRLVQLHLEREAYAEGIHFGRVLLELDATREDIHRDIMCCYSRLGQRSAALRQYRACFEAVQAELDLTPEPETTALYERLAVGEPI